MSLIDHLRAVIRFAVGALVAHGHDEPRGVLDAWDADAVMDVAPVAELSAVSEERVREAFTELVNANAFLPTRLWIRSLPPVEPRPCPWWLHLRRLEERARAWPSAAVYAPGRTAAIASHKRTGAE